MQARHGAFGDCRAAGRSEYTGLAEGSHTFQVRGVNASGPDPTPAATPGRRHHSRRPRRSHPPGRPQPRQHRRRSPTSQRGRLDFECSLARGAGSLPPAPPSGMIYHGLADGDYNFVRAIDPAGNQQPTPTALHLDRRQLARRHDAAGDHDRLQAARPERKLGATFTYSSNEPGSSFQCKLDGPLPAAAGGVPYTGRSNGPHAFQVRATDPGIPTPPRPATASRRAGAAASRASRRPAAGGPNRWRPSRPGDDPHRQARREDPRPDPYLPLPLRQLGGELPVQARPRPLQALPLALHDEEALLRPAHPPGPRSGAGISDPTPGRVRFKVVKG